VGIIFGYTLAVLNLLCYTRATYLPNKPTNAVQQK